MSDHEKINYLEFPTTDIDKTQEFFAAVFNWQFEAYGPQYCAFSGAGLDGGFYLAEQVASAAMLIVFYSDDLEATQAKVEQAGGTIVKEIFHFPGGRRFHFSEPCGNEFAVWGKVH